MNNKEQFDTVAYELTDKARDIDVNYYGKLEEISYEKFLKKNENDYIYICHHMVVYPNPNANINYKELEYFHPKFSLYDVNNLLDVSDLKYVDIYRDYILFVNREVSGFKVGLLYSQKRPPANVYKSEKIADNWYYCWVN